MTYSQSRNKAPFNWRDALSADNPDWELLNEFSGKWVTCACGNQDAGIERNFDGRPVDAELARLGLEFDKYVFWKRPQKALEILDHIEARAAKLLGEV